MCYVLRAYYLHIYTLLPLERLTYDSQVMVKVAGPSACTKHSTKLQNWQVAKSQKQSSLLVFVTIIFRSRVVFLCFHPCLASVLSAGPSLLVVLFRENFLPLA